MHDNIRFKYWMEEAGKEEERERKRERDTEAEQKS